MSLNDHTRKRTFGGASFQTRKKGIEPGPFEKNFTEKSGLLPDELRRIKFNESPKYTELDPREYFVENLGDKSIPEEKQNLGGESPWRSLDKGSMLEWKTFNAPNPKSEETRKGYYIISPKVRTDSAISNDPYDSDESDDFFEPHLEPDRIVKVDSFKLYDFMWVYQGDGVFCRSVGERDEFGNYVPVTISLAETMTSDPSVKEEDLKYRMCYFKHEGMETNIATLT